MKKRKYFIRFEIKDRDLTLGSKLKYIKKSKVLDKFEVGSMTFFIWYYKLGKVYQVVELKSGMMAVQSKISVKRAKRKFFKWLAKSNTTYSDLERMSIKSIQYYREMLEEKWHGKKCIKSGTFWEDNKKNKKLKHRFGRW